MGPQGWHIYLGCCFKSLGNRDEASSSLQPKPSLAVSMSLKINLKGKGKLLKNTMGQCCP